VGKGKKKPFRCTYEWDRVVGHDEREDAVLKRHICNRLMHHTGPHKSKTGHTSETPTSRMVK
jgi:hypothetical protein